MADPHYDKALMDAAGPKSGTPLHHSQATVHLLQCPGMNLLTAALRDLGRKCHVQLCCRSELEISRSRLMSRKMDVQLKHKIKIPEDCWNDSTFGTPWYNTITVVTVSNSLSGSTRDMADQSLRGTCHSTPARDVLEGFLKAYPDQEEHLTCARSFNLTDALDTICSLRTTRRCSCNTCRSLSMNPYHNPVHSTVECQAIVITLGEHKSGGNEGGLSSTSSTACLLYLFSPCLFGLSWIILH